MVATPLPTMSNAVPWAGVVNTVASPPVTVTPRLKPLSLVAIWPWSWYIVSTPSKSPPKPLMKTVSAGKGPLQSMPRAAAFATAGRDDLDLLAAEEAVLAAVGIERRDRDARRARSPRRAWWRRRA